MTDSPSNYIVPQNWGNYTQAEHDIWRTLFERQSKILLGRACDAFLKGVERLGLSSDRIPDFENLSKKLKTTTGWEVVAVPGLVPHAIFYEMLANRQFPAGYFIRTPEQLDYIQEPDIFHDVFGHVPLLSDPVFAEYMQAFGMGGHNAEAMGLVDILARVYWFTVEFGIMRKGSGFEIYGAGIVSSKTESVFCMESDSPNRIAFDLARMMRTEYRIDDLQPTYFVIDNFEQLLQLADVSFQPFYDATLREPSIPMGTLLETDRILTRGTLDYHHHVLQTQQTTPITHTSEY
jgi:phenylalanine-4-hydroxylase